MSTPLGSVGAAADAAMAAVQASPGWEEAIVTVPGSAALVVTVLVRVDDVPRGGMQRRGATILLPMAQCPNDPVDGTTVVTATDTWTVRTALEQTRLWRAQAWA